MLAGLPGTGKSTIAVPLARELRAPYLRIDREYEEWDRDRLVIDTAVVSVEKAVDVILQRVNPR